jgi:hypothetical protein
MHASIRKYKTDSAEEIASRVNQQFLDRISNVAGFLAYYTIDTGDGTIASVSVFETKDGQEESNRVAAAWIKESLPGMLNLIEIIGGEVVAHKAK